MAFVNLKSAQALEAFKKQIETAAVDRIARGNLCVDDALGLSEREAFAAFRLVRFSDTSGVPKCPKCQSVDCYELSTKSGWRCVHCGHDYTVTSGTMLSGGKMKLKNYLCLLSILLNPEQFSSLLSFSKEVGIDYKTAHTQIKRLKACATDDAGCTVPFHLLTKGAWQIRHALTRGNIPDRSLSPSENAYPYIKPGQRLKDSGVELIDFCNSFTPRWLPDHMRADISQDMILAILEGAETRKTIAADSKRFVRLIAAQYPWKYKWISFDAPKSEGDSRSLYEVASKDWADEQYAHARWS